MKKTDFAGIRQQQVRPEELQAGVRAGQNQVKFDFTPWSSGYATAANLVHDAMFPQVRREDRQKQSLAINQALDKTEFVDHAD